MAAPVSTTRLEAVNVILRVLGEAPVADLTPPVTDDVVMAEAVLDEVTREALTVGWSFNTETDIELVLDGNDEYVVPDDLIRVILDRPRVDVLLVFRADAGDSDIVKLYNKAKGQHTFTLPAGMKGTFVRFVDFEAAPEVFRRYVTIRAARTVQARLQGAGEATYSREEEVLAKAALRREEGIVEPRTMFDSWASFRVVDRPYPRTHSR